MKVVTVINDQQNTAFNLLRLSCVLHKLDLVVLVSKQREFSSNRIKDNMLKDYLHNELDYDELVFFTDGYDALFMATENEITDKFHKANKGLLFSCESACWPDKSLADQYPPPHHPPYSFLNSGGFIGKAGLIAELLEEEIDDPGNFRKSNQYVWTKKYFRHPDKIGLDTKCDIFHTFSPEVGLNYFHGKVRDVAAYTRVMEQWFESNFLIKNKRMYSKITGTWPCHAHFNGYSKVLINYDVMSMIFAMVPDYKNPVYFYEMD